jgi:putative addiction module component (TIGR02574 family)
VGKVKDKQLDELFNRSIAEKILAVEKLWDNIRESSILEKPSTAEKKIIKERIAEYKQKPSKVKSWEDVRETYIKKK